MVRSLAGLGCLSGTHGPLSSRLREQGPGQGSAGGEQDGVSWSAWHTARRPSGGLCMQPWEGQGDRCFPNTYSAQGWCALHT